MPEHKLQNPTFTVLPTDGYHPVPFPLVNQQGYALTCHLLFRVTVKQGGTVFTVSLMVGEPLSTARRQKNGGLYGNDIVRKLRRWEELQVGHDPKVIVTGLSEVAYLEKVVELVKQVWNITPRVGRLPLAGLGGADDV